MMNKRMCEQLLLQTLELAMTILQSYNPEADYLNMAFIKDDEGIWLHIDNANDDKFPVEGQKRISLEVAE